MQRRHRFTVQFQRHVGNLYDRFSRGSPTYIYLFAVAERIVGAKARLFIVCETFDPMLLEDPFVCVYRDFLCGSHANYGSDYKYFDILNFLAKAKELTSQLLDEVETVPDAPPSNLEKSAPSAIGEGGFLTSLPELFRIFQTQAENARNIAREQLQSCMEKLSGPPMCPKCFSTSSIVGDRSGWTCNGCFLRNSVRPHWGQSDLSEAISLLLNSKPEWILRWEDWLERWNRG